MARKPKPDTIPQRVFCIFFRPIFQNSRGRMVDVDFSQARFLDDTSCVDGTTFTSFWERWYATSKAMQNLQELTDPGNTPELQRYRQALQFHDPKTGERKTYKVHQVSRGLQPFNDDMMFTQDFWFLHSTWTSFEKLRAVVRLITDAFGFDSIMTTSYVPLDINILPDK